MKRTLLKSSMVICMLLASLTINAFTAVMSGNWSNAATWGGLAPGATVLNQDIIIPAGLDVTLDMDVSFTGLLNSFSVNGSLMGGTNSLVIDQGPLSGSGTLDIGSLTFNTLGTSSFTGGIIVNKFKNAGATLILSAVVSISDTLNLDAGSILINAGANVSPMASSTIRINSGTMTIGGGIFNSGSSYDVVYVGTSKTTGIEVNTTVMQNLRIMLNDNSQTLTLGSSLTVNGDLDHASGVFDISGRTLTLRGDILAGTGVMITSNASANLLVMGSNSPTDGLSFSAGSSINTLEVDLSAAGASLDLLTSLGVSGTLALQDGTLMLQTGSTLTMNAGSTVHVENGMLDPGTGTFTGTAAYNVEYMGNSVSTGVETTGPGLNNFTVNLMAGTDMVTMSNDISLAGSFNLTMGQLSLNGNDLILNGTFNQNSATAIHGNIGSDLELNLDMALNDSLYLAAANNVLKDLVINITGGGTIYLGSHVQIANQVNMMSGKLDIFNSNLIIQSTGTITGTSDVRYIVTSGTGKLHMRVNAASPYVTFPIGTTNNYSPAYIQQTAMGTSGDFMIGAVADAYSSGSTGTSIAATHSMVARTWFIDAAMGVVVNMNLKLGWQAAAEVNGFDRTDAYISHYTTMWDVSAAGSAASGPDNTYELTRTGINNLNTSAFSVMDTTVATGLTELTASELSIYPNPVSDELNVTGGGKDQLIEIMDAVGKIIISQTTGGNTKLSVSHLESGCYLIRVTDQDTKKVTIRRLIRS